ncbi:hypothetical protein D3C80_1401400 [compost metagenome]
MQADVGNITGVSLFDFIEIPIGFSFELFFELFFEIFFEFILIKIRLNRKIPSFYLS